MKEKNWSNEELTAFCLEFSLLIKTGMSVGEGFSILSENEQNPEKKKFLLSLYEKTLLSTSVHQTMREAGVFPPYMLKLIYIGEETGHLEDCFASLSRYFDQRIRTRRLIKETVMFPLMLFVMMLVVAILLLTEVLPIFQSVFAQLGGTLPASALFFLNLGVGLKKGRFIFLGIFIILVVLAVLAGLSSSVQQKVSTFFKRHMTTTKVGKLSAQAHFASALSMTIRSGLDTGRALEIAEDFCAETFLKEKIHRCKARVQSGEPFANAVEQEGLLKPMYSRMLAIGIKSGNIDEVLSEIARRTEEDAAFALTKAASIVEPAVVIILSILVGFLLLSVMFPLVGIMSSLG
ncbi:type II secretion system protein F [Anaerotignum neopropionicum]|uniref:Type II secretion system protein F n=1 Tax=Anaerotignum neopropionicum TaxID=36847 RepID=A0A136WFU6_9FIRM|nr:type II secretion system F family protein [Anaerotignum neopropionicum]KXL53239.1 type II secretion system protein F [Anaerotignum neopropionicum]